jgi:thiamine biosynthesis lipoprotein
MLVAALAPATTGDPRAGGAPPAGPPAHGAGAASIIRARFLMGTPLIIEASAPDASRAIEAAFSEVARLEESLSNWRPSSEVSRMNRDAALAPFAAGRDLCEVVGRALDWAAASGGAFDPTVEPLVRALGLRGADGRLPGQPAPPAPEGLGPIGWRGVHLDRKACTIGFAATGMGIDLGGIGKGFALDAAAAVLRRAGATAARLDFGGQVLIFGHGPDDGGWRIGVADPRDRDLPALAVVLHSGSIATSSAGERRVPGLEGTPIGHLLDPVSGRPIAWDGSVSVRAGNATDADALSTALFVMGPERGLAWAAGRDLDVVYLAPDAGGGLARRTLGALFETESPGSPSPGAPADLGVDRSRETHAGDPQS